MEAKDKISESLNKVLSGLNISETSQVEDSSTLDKGDYSSSIALKLAKSLGKNPMELATDFVSKLKSSNLVPDVCSKIEASPPGFINFYLSDQFLLKTLSLINLKKEDFGKGNTFKNTKVMVEYAHPNTHKEMHIGHMRTLITGESIARLFEATGANVFRANYQGDIGPHVAKALYGIQKIMAEESLSISGIEKWSNIEKAHFLGKGYVRGNVDYESHKQEIDELNEALYKRDKKIWDLYEKTRKWNLDYYNDFYERFYTRFDNLFFESQMDEPGKKIVLENVGKIFEESEGAIIFPGKKYGLHNRVFITSAGNPTYEGKEMGNAYAEYNAFSFDKKIHVVANEQSGYFQVVFKALELIDPEKFRDKQLHLSMGMVQLSDRKMSSRTGDVLTVDWLIDEVKKKVRETIEKAKVTKKIEDEILEPVTIGAIKYSVLKQGAGQDVAFNIESSVSLDGNSGPYLQYTYVRTQSVLAKYQIPNTKNQNYSLQTTHYNLNFEEENVLRSLTKFEDVIEKAAQTYSPNILATYLFDLSQRFNLFYQKHSIINPVIAIRQPAEKQSLDDVRNFRLNLTSAVGQVLKTGLHLLGIETVEKM